MKQTEIEWLTDPDHNFKRVKHSSNRNGSIKSIRDRYSDDLAKSYGYNDHADMISKMNKKHNEMKIKYGDRYIQGWL